MRELRLTPQAFSILIRDRTLLLLAFLPGVLTLLLTAAAIWGLWTFWLADLSGWIAVPLFIITAPVLWIAFGNLAIIPFEDPIIDHVQRKVWGEVKIPAPPFSVKRMAREIWQSLSFTLILFSIVLISFLPGIGFVAFMASAWITSWSFLSTVLHRQFASASDKRRIFFRHAFGNLVLGAILNILLFVPILNVWLLGFALVLTSLVHAERQ